VGTTASSPKADGIETIFRASLPLNREIERSRAQDERVQETAILTVGGVCDTGNPRVGKIRWMMISSLAVTRQIWTCREDRARKKPLGGQLGENVAESGSLLSRPKGGRARLSATYAAAPQSADCREERPIVPLMTEEKHHGNQSERYLSVKDI
jgi:hypothetical protein